MTFEEKFRKLSEKLCTVDTSKLCESFAIQINMTDKDCGGTFYVANINNNFSVEPYDYRDHTAMITATAEDIAKIFSGRLKLDNGIVSGRFIVEGNPEHIRIVASAFPKPAKKTAVAKKEEKSVQKKSTNKKADKKTK